MVRRTSLRLDIEKETTSAGNKIGSYVLTTRLRKASKIRTIPPAKQILLALMEKTKNMEAKIRNIV